MQDANLTWQSLDRIVLVGGSTFLPAVRRMLEQAHGRKPDTRVHPMTAVAQGAALYAHLLETGTAHRELIQLVGHGPASEQPSESSAVTVPTVTPNEVTARPAPEPSRSAVLTTGTKNSTPQPRSSLAMPTEGTNASASTAAATKSPSPPKPPVVPSPQVTFVTASGFGVAVMQGNSPKNTILIPKNTPVPTECTKKYYTVAKTDDHTVIPINVTQGDSEKVALVEPLGTVLIEGLPPGEPPGQEIRVTFQLDAQGRLQVQAVYVNTGQSVRATLEVAGCLHKDEVQKYRAALLEKGLVNE